MTFTESVYSGHREWKTFASTDGSFTEQVITQVGTAVEANAIEGDEHQRRSYPDAGGGYRAAGYEYIRGLDLLGNAEPVGEEAVALLQAPQCPSGLRTIVLDPSMLYLQIHESCGHPSELDRVFGTEASYAGTSFLTPDKLQEGFQYGSELVTIVADATAPGGMGTFGWDDEGVAAQAVPLVKNGRFVGYLSSRETAPRVGLQSTGAMRADGWNRIPLIRMTNVNMLPVPGMSLDEIVADTDDGLYLANNRSWSIDDRRLNFQFATEVAYEIKGGKKGQLYKNATYTGITYEFWRSCDAVGDDRSFVMLGTPNCGKGEPSQTARVGHAVPGAPIPERPGGSRQVVSRRTPRAADGDAVRRAARRIPRRPSRLPRTSSAGRCESAPPRPRSSSWPATRRSPGSPTARSTRTSPSGTSR